MLASLTSPSANGHGAKPGRSADHLAIADPELAAAAALLLAAGYSVEPPAGEPGWMPDRLPHLSHREEQVASLLIEGASNKVIARALDISVHTAKFHVAAILEKLSAQNRADAVSIILREGLVVL
jgi:DNA-binding NarL/FixJ family response regulator